MLQLGELVRQGNKKLAIARALIRRKSQNTGQVVILTGIFLLGEVANDVIALLVRLAQHVEEEGVHVVVECLMVQEELGKEAEVLAIDRS